MAIVHLVQHAQKTADPGDPGLTPLGREQATRTGQWLAGVGLTAVYASPLRRAQETGQLIAALNKSPLWTDERLRERVNWEAGQPLAEFLDDWAATTRDRDHVPRHGDSSRAAGERLRGFLLDQSGVVAAVVHGGVTVDLLRTLLGDSGLLDDLIELGVPSCAITTVDGQRVVEIASTTHLEQAQK